ncbi:MAG: hypothetical protein EA384_16415 [Spirochaetaceae bacterium]|nr:MAG: hypothetical protein EA384_16415 [Spirochaetaceae bacterium]
MKYSATVISVDGQTVELSSPTRLCGACPALACSPRAYVFTARNQRGIELRPADQVEYEISTPRVLGTAIALFGAFPLLFLGAFFAVRVAAPVVPQSGAVAAGLMLVLLIAALRYRRERPRSQFDMPTVLRKLSVAESSTES